MLKSIKALYLLIQLFEMEEDLKVIVGAHTKRYFHAMRLFADELNSVRIDQS